MIIPVKSGNHNYDVVVKSGALNEIDKYLNLNRKVLVVTDDGVPSAYSDKILSFCKIPFKYVLEQGEKSKNFDELKEILKFLTDNCFTRSDCIVAVGGGVVGDISGFAASVYMRGIDFYNVPTTVLSQVDSSVGGKTAIDFCGYKNIIGSFYPPKCVVADVKTLETLDDRQFSNGLAESVKMALTCDCGLFRMFEQNDVKSNIEKIIEKSIKIKADVVVKDEKEKSLRKVLNFGHTIGHAIESENGSLLHGECVALGMLYFCSDEVKKRLKAVLEKLNLPTKTDVDYVKIKKAILHDKKADDNEITVVKVQKAGQFEFEKFSAEKIIELMKGAD